MHRILVDDPSTFIGPLHGPHLCHGAEDIVHSIIRCPGHFLCGLSVSYKLSKFLCYWRESVSSVVGWNATISYAILACLMGGYNVC
jgi:hypothetical protein